MKYLKIFVIAILLLCTSFSTFVYSATDDLTTYSPICLLMEAKTGKVIYEKNGYEKAYPASTTKIMTAILALENCELTDVATASYEAIYSVPVGYSNANIQVGEELTIEQLLNVLLVHSANEAANILAEHIAGSVESFATMMNTKAQELGCLNTNFVNPNGVHNENHYSTAYDLALIGRYAMQNDTFRKLVSTTFYTLPATNKYETNDRVFSTTNSLLKKDSSNSYCYEYCTGIKTGYTNLAKNCIVASAKKDGVEYIVVILGAESTESGLSARYLDCKNLFDYAFENYTVKTLYEAGSTLQTVKVSNANGLTRNLNVIVQDNLSVLVKQDTDITNISPTIEIDSDLKAPIAQNTVIGKITYTIDGNEYSSNLLAGDDAIVSNAVNSFLTIVSIIIAVFLLYKLLGTNDKKSKKKKNDKKKNDYLYW
jgi:D-alanyl-D-alanine carboxypeptidase (penicillin-binding protein 5/6)